MSCDSAAPSRPTVSASIGQRLREPPEAASGDLYCPAPEGGKPTRPTNPRPGRMCFMRMLSFRRSNITTRPDLDSQQGARGEGYEPRTIKAGQRGGSARTG